MVRGHTDSDGVRLGWKNLNHKRCGWKVPEEIFRMASQLELGGAFLRRNESQNPHPNVAKGATLGWATRDFFSTQTLARGRAA